MILVRQAEARKTLINIQIRTILNFYQLIIDRHTNGRAHTRKCQETVYTVQIEKKTTHSHFSIIFLISRQSYFKQFPCLFLSESVTNRDNPRDANQNLNLFIIFLHTPCIDAELHVWQRVTARRT